MNPRHWSKRTWITIAVAWVVVGVIGVATSSKKKAATTSTAASAPAQHSSSPSRTNTSTPTTSTPATSTPEFTTAEVTTFWRRQITQTYGGPVSTDDGRGCAQQSKTRWVCTAYSRQNPNQNTGLYGTVTVQNGALTASAHLNRGSEITDWFAHTNGGCQQASCAGTVYR